MVRAHRIDAAVWMSAGWTVGSGGDIAPLMLTDDECVAAAAALARVAAAEIGVRAAASPPQPDLAPAERPLLIAGTGCLDGGAELADLVERSGIPIVVRGAARGLIADDHPGVIPGAGPSAAVLARADHVVRVHDAAHARALAGTLAPGDLHPWWAEIGEIVGDHAARAARGARGPASPPHAARIGAELAQRFGARGCLVTDTRLAGIADQIIARAPGAVMVLDEPGDAIAFAAGWRLARPDEPVLAVCDAAALERSGLDLVPAARAGAPVAVLVLDPARTATPSYELLAEIAGGVGDVADSPRALSIALTNALTAKVPSVIRISVAAATG